MKIHTNSRFLRIMTSLSVLCAFMMFANPLQASTLSNAQYMRPIDITNSGAASTNNAVLFDPDTLGMLNSGFINSSLTGSAVTDLANRDLIYMPQEPVRYKLVQYLESNGTQYIDTGFVPNANTKWVINFTPVLMDGTWQAMGALDTYNTTVYFRTYIYNNFGVSYATNGGYNLGSLNSNKQTLVLDAKNLYASCNSTTVSISGSASVNDVTLYLFAQHQRTAENILGVNSQAQIKLYSSQIYDNGVLVRNFVPVQRTSDDVLGLYDTVNRVFYTNQGTGSFTTEQYDNTLYICDYVDFNGSQYLDTGFIPSNSSAVAITGQYLSTPTAQRYLAGIYDNSSGTVNRFYLGSWFSGGDILNMYGTATTGLAAVTFNQSQTYTCELNPLHGFATINDSRDTFTPAGGSFSLSIPIAAQNDGTFHNPISMRLYSFMAMNNGALQRNMIPCYNVQAQNACLYDNVNNQIYNVQGTGAFDYKISGTSGDWIIYLPTVAANTTLQERLYISTENLNSHIVYFPGSQGMTVNRSSGLTLAGSDDWNFTIDGHSISGNGGYLFRYGSDLSASLQGNTVTFNYGTITIPTTVQVHNTSWAYYWGTLASGYTFVSNHGTVSNNTSTKKIGASTVYTWQRTFISLRTTLSSNPYNLMVVRNDLQANTTRQVGYATSDTYEPTTSQTVSSAGALTLQSLPTGSTVYPLIYVKGSSALNNSAMGVDAYMIAFAKPDNPAQYSTLSKYGQDATAMLTRASDMLNDLGAVITLATRCTGDFMWRCVQSTAFNTALNSSPYKSIITSSLDWAKALAWNTGSYTQTAPTGASVELSTTQVVPIGDHTYSFRKEDNAISIYVDGMVVRGGIFNETSYYSALTSLGYTYSDVASYDPSATITLAQGDSMLFVNNMEISKNDSVIGKWSWTHTDTFTFPDQSGNGNTGNPSFRTEPYGSVNNGQNLSVNLGAYSPANTSQYIPPGGTSDSDFDGLIPGNQQPDQNVDIENIKNIPFAEVFEDILAAGGIPSQLFWLPLIMTLAIAAMMVTYNFTRDALIACIAGDVVIGLGIALSVLYTVPLVIGIITTIVLLVKRKTISL